MAIRTIGVALMSAEEIDWLIPTAAALARKLGAHLIGIHAVEAVVPYAGVTVYDPVLVPEFLDWQVEETAVTRAEFERVTLREGVSAEFRAQETPFGATDFLLDGLRSSDLVVTGRLERRGWQQSQVRLQEALIRNSGRPVVMLPKGKPLEAPTGHLMIGWSPTREATRAAHDALALAAPGAAIDLLSVRSGSERRLTFDSRQDLAAAFDRLGFKVSLVDREGGAGDAGELLLRAAFERGAELVATGAFGHSRAYDFVVGAVTSHLLENAELPVLFSK